MHTYRPYAFSYFLGGTPLLQSKPRFGFILKCGNSPLENQYSSTFQIPSFKSDFQNEAWTVKGYSPRKIAKCIRSIPRISFSESCALQIIPRKKSVLFSKMKISSLKWAFFFSNRRIWEKNAPFEKKILIFEKRTDFVSLFFAVCVYSIVRK